jgi:long-chain acyl-CoA synthetase
MEGRLSNKRWLAAYGDRIPIAISPDAHVSVLEMLESAMRAFADRPAFRCFGQTLTYADTDRLSRQFAAYLQARLGVKKADRIAVIVLSENSIPLRFPVLAFKFPSKASHAKSPGAVLWVFP